MQTSCQFTEDSEDLKLGGDDAPDARIPHSKSQNVRFCFRSCGRKREIFRSGTYVVESDPGSRLKQTSLQKHEKQSKTVRRQQSQAMRASRTYPKGSEAVVRLTWRGTVLLKSCTSLRKFALTIAKRRVDSEVAAASRSNDDSAKSN